MLDQGAEAPFAGRQGRQNPFEIDQQHADGHDQRQQGGDQKPPGGQPLHRSQEGVIGPVQSPEDEAPTGQAPADAANVLHGEKQQSGADGNGGVKQKGRKMLGDKREMNENSQQHPAGAQDTADPEDRGHP